MKIIMNGSKKKKTMFAFGFVDSIAHCSFALSFRDRLAADERS